MNLFTRTFSKIFKSSNQQELDKIVPFMFIHGGTDTQGEVFDDGFLLRLTFDNDQ